MSDKSTDEVRKKDGAQFFAEFLESTPPNQMTNISDLCVWNGKTSNNVMSTPEIQLHCGDASCDGIRFFRCFYGKHEYLQEGSPSFTYIKYRCSNCQKTVKTYSLAVILKEHMSSTGDCYKFGELPTYGPPVSPKLIKLIGPDRDEFLKGRRCENQGLGVGAFIYYRRVVENQKDRIIGEIIKVSEKIGAKEDSITQLKAAIKETQFNKALKMAKDVMPESLLINGHSPILLLHSALSEGVHKLSDERCLELANSIRVVLGELSERLSQALKDEAQLKSAISNLLNRKED